MSVLLMSLAVECADCLSGSGDYHTGVCLRDSEMFGYLVEFPSVAVVPIKNLAVARRELGFYQTVDFGNQFYRRIRIIVGFRVSIDGIDIGFRMSLPSSLTVDGDVACGYCQESFGLALRREVSATGP